ncbi:hypothetical protein ACWGE0_33285 [Lentzea sp. NPDC054927]
MDRWRTARRSLWKAAIAVVAVTGLLVVSVVVAIYQATHEPDQHFDEWPLRGGLAGDEALLARAEQVWRDTGVPDGDVMPLHAERLSSPNVVQVTLFGHTADDRPVVAFVSSPVTTGTPSGDRLFVRALNFPVERATAVGFVATNPDPADLPFPDGGSLAFALSAPGVPSAHVVSSVGGIRVTRPSQTFWQVMPRGTGAWNSMITTMGSTEAQMWPATGVHDRPSTRVGTVRYADGTATIDRGTPVAGDLVLEQHRLLGVVTDVSGLVDITAATWAAHGEVRTQHAGVPGKLTYLPTGHLFFTPGGPGEITENDGVMFMSTINPDVVVRVGKMSRADGGWQVDRSAYPPFAPREAQVVTPR